MNQNWRKIFLFLDITVFFNFYFALYFWIYNFTSLQVLICLHPGSTRELSPVKFAARNESMTSETGGTEPSAFCTPDFSREDCVSICANKMPRPSKKRSISAEAPSLCCDGIAKTPEK